MAYQARTAAFEAQLRRGFIRWEVAAGLLCAVTPVGAYFQPWLGVACFVLSLLIALTGFFRLREFNPLKGNDVGCFLVCVPDFWFGLLFLACGAFPLVGWFVFPIIAALWWLLIYAAVRSWDKAGPKPPQVS